MASRCSSCTAALPRVARFCPRCGLATRRPPGQPLAVVLVLAAILIVLSNLTMRAVTIGNTSSTLHMPTPTPAPALLHVRPSRNIETNPLLLLDRDIAVRDLRLHGVRLGDARTRIARAFVTRTSAGEVRCYDGNAYECRDGLVTRIVLNDPAILLRLPCRESLSVFSSFGAPDAVEDLAGEDRVRFTYASRGLTLRWNRRTSRIDQVILSNPQLP